MSTPTEEKPDFARGTVSQPVCTTSSNPSSSNWIRRYIQQTASAKLLTVLRILGRGMIVQDDLDHSGMSRSMVRKTFRHVISLMSQGMFDAHVHLPRNTQEMRETMRMYENVGLPGCLGSMDATHVPWDNCPFVMRNAHVGKEGFPTLTHNCVVSNDLYFMSVTRAKPGAFNDKTLVRFDSASERLRNGEFRDVQFDLFNSNGKTETHRDVYLIVDGGYHM